jgi:ribosomal protein L9
MCTTSKKPANAGSEDKLFGSVGPVDIVEALAAVQVEVERAGKSASRRSVYTCTRT